jgi:hypothetical protein
MKKMPNELFCLISVSLWLIFVLLDSLSEEFT